MNAYKCNFDNIFHFQVYFLFQAKYDCIFNLFQERNK